MTEEEIKQTFNLITTVQNFQNDEYENDTIFNILSLFIEKVTDIFDTKYPKKRHITSNIAYQIKQTLQRVKQMKTNSFHKLQKLSKLPANFHQCNNYSEMNIISIITKGMLSTIISLILLGTLEFFNSNDNDKEYNLMVNHLLEPGNDEEKEKLHKKRKRTEVEEEEEEEEDDE